MAREVYECVLSANLAGQFVQTVQHQAVDDPSGGLGPYLNAQNLGLELLSVGGAYDKLLECLPEVYVPTSLRIRRVSTGGGPTWIMLSGAFPGFTLGQRGPEISSAQVNPVSVWIPETEPSKTGRIFYPGVAESDIANMVLVGDLITAIEAFQTAWIGATVVSAVGDFFGCVFRRASKTGDLIDDAYVSPLIGTQRRRLHPV